MDTCPLVGSQCFVAVSAQIIGRIESMLLKLEINDTVAHTSLLLLCKLKPVSNHGSISAGSGNLTDKYCLFFFVILSHMLSELTLGQPL